MKLKTFEKIMNNLKEMYDEGIEYDHKLQEAFGGDTVIMTDWWSTGIEKTLDIISNDMGDTTGAIDWLFWESMLSTSSPMTFAIDDVDYEGTPENVWLEIKGKLKRKNAIDKKKKNETN